MKVIPSLTRLIKPVCFNAFLLAGMAAGPSIGSYVNQLKGDLGVHDPVMIREGDVYRVYCTGGLISSKTSTDRITWKNTGSGLTAPGWIKTYVPANNGSDFWAPDISFRDNKYWLYYSVSTFDSNTSAIGLATSPALANPTWTDQGMVIGSQSGNNYNCIDPNAFNDADGKTYLLFGSFWSGIKMVEVDPATGKPATGSPAIISMAAHSAGIEGAFLFKWGEFYYLFVSWDKCCDGCNSTYKIVAGRATNVRGPYVNKAGTAMTAGGGDVLDSGDAIRRGPGHNGIFIEHDTVFCINHYYNCNSTMQIRPLYFDGGWPSFSGTRTGPSGVMVHKKVPIPENGYIPEIKVCYGSTPDVRNGRRVFTISGKEVTGMMRGTAHHPRSSAQGVFIVAMRR